MFIRVSRDACIELTITSRHQVISGQKVYVSEHITECPDVMTTHFFVLMPAFWYGDIV